jgi:hypothetical protein
MQHLIDKRTGTYADALEAIGIASLLRDLGSTGITITDDGSCFRVQGLDPPDPWSTPSPGYPYIWESAKEEKPDISWIFDYVDAKQKREASNKFLQAQRKAQSKVRTALEILDLEPPSPPPPETGRAVILASMRKGWNGDRELAKWITSNPVETMAWVEFNLGVQPTPPRDQPSISNSQTLNPISGKGVHAPKTELRSPNALPTLLVDSFGEWMKLRGLWRGMFLYRSDDDFKFFVIEPSSISLDGLNVVKQDLDSLNLWGGVRLDIEAALRCAEVLILHSDVLQSQETGSIGLRNLKPRNVIAGLRQSYFKSLGTAAALMNDALLPLPDWFVISAVEDADDYLEIIDEAIGSVQVHPRKYGCLGSLQEKNSDDGKILQQYRQWILTGDLFELLEFHHQFAQHLMQRLSARDWAQPFSTVTLTKLLTKTYNRGYQVKEILEDEGFKSLARAIRNSTIYALTLPNSQREVYFGLAQKWKQKLKGGPSALMTEIADFVQTQNWEVVNKLKGRGHVVTTQHLDSLIALIDKHGAELVGSLLLAYGYARAPKVEDEKEG